MDGVLREEILDRDGYVCTECNCNKRYRLHVHHKDKNKKNDHKDNLITLCVLCHAEKHPINYKLLMKDLSRRMRKRHCGGARKQTRRLKWEKEDRELTEQFLEKFGYENTPKVFKQNGGES